MTAKPTVLVVEDDYFVAHGLAAAFQNAGFEVLGPVASADAALAVARGECPQLTVMDVRIDGKRDGVEAAHELRAFCDCPILFHTAHADAETASRIRAMPNAELLRKPAATTALLRAAHAALAEAPTRAAPPQPTAPPDDGAPVVLVVDDNEMVRETVTQILELAGCRVLQACDGLEGVALFAGGQVDLVFCDLLMPRRGGLEALRTFKQLAPDIPVVVMTGAPARDANGEQADVAAARAGAAEVLHKPFRAAHVRDALSRWLPPTRRARTPRPI